jgi:hypothetical protein
MMMRIQINDFITSVFILVVETSDYNPERLFLTMLIRNM